MTHEQIYNTFCKPNQDEIKQDIKDILHTIKGNGTPGLVTRVAILEQLNGSSEKKQDAMSWIIKNWQAILIVLVVIISTINALSDNRLTREEVFDIIKQSKMLDENITGDK